MKAARYTRASITPAQPTIPKVSASAPRILLVDDEDAVQKPDLPAAQGGYDVVPALDGRRRSTASPRTTSTSWCST